MKWAPFATAVMLTMTGCLGQAEPDETEAVRGEPCAVRIPMPDRGSSFLYDVSGMARDQASYWIGHWPDADEMSRGDVHLRAGSTLQVTFSTQEAYRLRTDGHLVASYSIDYRLEAPDHNGSLDVLREWFDATGTKVQFVQPSASRPGQGNDHVTSWGVDGYNYGMDASLFWNTTVHDGHAGIVNLTRVVSYGTDEVLTWSADIIADDPCTVRVTWFDHDEQVRVRDEFIDGWPLPARRAFTLTPVGPPFTAELTSVLNGSVPFVIEKDAFSTSPRYMPSAAPIDSMPVGGKDLFPTPYTDALEEAKKAPEAQAWFEAHPDGQVVDLMHLYGRSGGDFRDGWQLLFADSSGDAPPLFTKVAWKRTQTLILPEEWGYETTAIVGSSEPPPAWSNLNMPWITVDEMFQLYRDHAEEEPNMFSCGPVGKRGACALRAGDLYIDDNAFTLNTPFRIAPDQALVEIAREDSPHAFGPPIEHPPVDAMEPWQA